MADRVKVLTRIKGFTEAWHQLSDGERQAWWEKLEAITDRAGGEWLIQCDSRWADEEYPFWGVMEYPSLEACRQAVAENEEAGWYRYIVATTLLGMDMHFQPGERGISA